MTRRRKSHSAVSSNRCLLRRTCSSDFLREVSRATASRTLSCVAHSSGPKANLRCWDVSVVCYSTSTCGPLTGDECRVPGSPREGRARELPRAGWVGRSGSLPSLAIMPDCRETSYALIVLRSRLALMGIPRSSLRSSLDWSVGRIRVRVHCRGTSTTSVWDPIPKKVANEGFIECVRSRSWWGFVSDWSDWFTVVRSAFCVEHACVLSSAATATSRFPRSRVRYPQSHKHRRCRTYQVVHRYTYCPHTVLE